MLKKPSKFLIIIALAAFLLIIAVLAYSPNSSKKNISHQNSTASEITGTSTKQPEAINKAEGTISVQPGKNATDTKVPENLRFIVMADSRGDNNGINLKIVKSTMEEIKKLNPQPQFAVLPGDLYDSSTTFVGVKIQLEY